MQPGARRRARVLVVEDETPTREGVAAALRGEGYLVETAADGIAAIALAADLVPHLAILDVNLGVPPDGLVLARRLRQAPGQSGLGVIFVTAIGEAFAQGLADGADDYVTKPFRLEELLARVRAVLRRTGPLRPPLLAVGDLVLDEATHQVVRGGVTVHLTPKEYELLAARLRRQGEVVSKLQLLGEVWEYRSGGQNLVEINVSSLRRKLERHGPRLIHTFRGYGYVARV